MTQAEKFDQTAFIVDQPILLTKVVQNHRCFNVVKARAECGGPALCTPFCFVFHLRHPLPYKYASQHPEVAPKDQTL